MINHIYLSGKSKMETTHIRPTSLTIMNEFLRKIMARGQKNLEFEINTFCRYEYNQFQTYGAVRLEILFYEKTSSSKKQEQIMLYGVAENVRSQLRSFTLFYDTHWFNEQTHYPEDKYFDSVIFNSLGTAHRLSGSQSEINFRDSQGIITGHCSINLLFASEANDEFSDHASKQPTLSVRRKRFQSQRVI